MIITKSMGAADAARNTAELIVGTLKKVNDTSEQLVNTDEAAQR